MTIILGGTTPPSYERRISARFPIGTPLDWAPAGTPWWKRAKAYPTVITDNLSISGAGFETATRPEVERGSPVKITIGDAQCVATVRSARPAATPGHTIYGIEFGCQSVVDEVEGLIEGHLGVQGPDDALVR